MKKILSTYLLTLFCLIGEANDCDSIRQIALKGEYKVTLSIGITATSPTRRFKKGETVSIIAKEKIGSKDKYLLFSHPYKYAIYTSYPNQKITNGIVSDSLPSFNDVPDSIWKHKAVCDSIYPKWVTAKLDSTVASNREREAKMDAERIQQMEKRCDSQYKLGYAITIVKADFNSDTRGRLRPFITFSNNSKKTIKYATFVVKYKNAVGDWVCNDLTYSTRNQYTSSLLYTGPLERGGEVDVNWDTDFYNTTAFTMVIQSVSITYMDGSKTTSKINKY